MVWFLVQEVCRLTASVMLQVGLASRLLPPLLLFLCFYRQLSLARQRLCLALLRAGGTAPRRAGLLSRAAGVGGLGFRV